MYFVINQVQELEVHATSQDFDGVNFTGINSLKEPFH